MIFRSKKKRRSEIEDYGHARVRDLAFDALMDLWRTRQQEGRTQRDIAARLDRDPAWVSRQLKGPGNWTLRTFGALVEALDGEAEITVYPLDTPAQDGRNYDAYASLDAVGSAWNQRTPDRSFVKPLNGAEQRVPA